MSLIINDFEVEVGPPAARGVDAPAPDGGDRTPPPPPLAPADLDDLLTRRAQRRVRLEAH